MFCGGLDRSLGRSSAPGLDEPAAPGQPPVAASGATGLRTAALLGTEDGGRRVASFHDVSAIA
jgi:hypothetical protein